MRSRFLKFPRARLIALATSGAVVGSLALAGPSLAAAPTAGTNCQPDGKIDGVGSTLQQWLQNSPGTGWTGVAGETAVGGGFISGFAQNVCGPVGPDPASFGSAGDVTDPGAAVDFVTNGNTFLQDESVAYNFPNAQDTSQTGSGAGIAAISCRQVAFAGTDIPYTNSGTAPTQWGKMNGTPGQAGSGQFGGAKDCNVVTNNVLFQAPFAPQAGGPSSTTAPGFPASYPNPGDNSATVLSFPIATSAVAVPVNLPAYCLPAGGAAVQLSTADIAGIWAGTTLNWTQITDAGLQGTPSGSACTTTSGGSTPLPIVRVVRQDNSGTTQGFVNYLANTSSANTCTGGTGSAGTFALMKSNEATNGTNVNWPYDGTSLGTDLSYQNAGGAGAATANCSAVTHAQGSGNQNLLNLLETGETGNQANGVLGGIGYSDYSDVYHDNNASPVDISVADIQPSTGAAAPYPAPNSGGTLNHNLGAIGKSNCSSSNASLSVSGSNASRAVGTTGDWAAGSTQSDVSWAAQGSGYPICSLTWDFVYKGVDGNAVPSVAGTATAQGIPATSLTVTGVNGLPNSGTISFTDSLGATEVATYSGLVGDTFGTTTCAGSGCQLTGVSFVTTPGGGAQLPASATIKADPASLTAAAQPQSVPVGAAGVFGLASTTGALASGTVEINNSASQVVKYTGVSGNTLTGASGGGNGLVSDGTNVAFQETSVSTATTINASTTTLPVGSTAAFPATGTFLVKDNSGNQQTLSYTGTTGTSFTGVTLPGGLTADTFNSGALVYLPSATTTSNPGVQEGALSVSSTAGFPTNGTVTVTTGAGAQTLRYSGITGSTLQNVSGGTGAAVTGNPVVVTSAAGLGGPEPNLTPDQRRTLYAYFSYILSPAGQAQTANAGYNSLPAGPTYLDELRVGFQGNF